MKLNVQSVLWVGLVCSIMSCGALKKLAHSDTDDEVDPVSGNTYVNEADVQRTSDYCSQPSYISFSKKPLDIMALNSGKSGSIRSYSHALEHSHKSLERNLNPLLADLTCGTGSIEPGYDVIGRKVVLQGNSEEFEVQPNGDLIWKSITLKKLEGKSAPDCVPPKELDIERSLQGVNFASASNKYQDIQFADFTTSHGQRSGWFIGEEFDLPFQYEVFGHDIEICTVKNTLDDNTNPSHVSKANYNCGIWKWLDENTVSKDEVLFKATSRKTVQRIRPEEVDANSTPYGGSWDSGCYPVGKSRVEFLMKEGIELPNESQYRKAWIYEPRGRILTSRLSYFKDGATCTGKLSIPLLAFTRNDRVEWLSVKNGENFVRFNLQVVGTQTIGMSEFMLQLQGGSIKYCGHDFTQKTREYPVPKFLESCDEVHKFPLTSKNIVSLPGTVLFFGNPVDGDVNYPKELDPNFKYQKTSR